jgi:hypothetical protein
MKAQQDYQALREYCHAKGSPAFRNDIDRCFSLPEVGCHNIIISSESGRPLGKTSLRLGINSLHYHTVKKWLATGRWKHLNAYRFMFSNHRDPCFGLGLVDHKPGQRHNRIKIYNFYQSSGDLINIRNHLHRICSLTDIPFHDVSRDWASLGKAGLSAVDMYENDRCALKVYFGPFLTPQLPKIARNIISPDALRQYQILREENLLSNLFYLCIRYGRSQREVKTDFRYFTYRIAPYLRHLDSGREASKIYQELYQITPRPFLSFIAFYMLKKPRIEFNFRFCRPQ